MRVLAIRGSDGCSSPPMRLVMSAPMRVLAIRGTPEMSLAWSEDLDAGPELRDWPNQRA